MIKVLKEVKHQIFLCSQNQEKTEFSSINQCYLLWAGRPVATFGCSRYGAIGVPRNEAVFKALIKGGFISDVGTSDLYSLVNVEPNITICPSQRLRQDINCDK